MHSPVSEMDHALRQAQNLANQISGYHPQPRGHYHPGTRPLHPQGPPPPSAGRHHAPFSAPGPAPTHEPPVYPQAAKPSGPPLHPLYRASFAVEEVSREVAQMLSSPRAVEIDKLLRALSLAQALVNDLNESHKVLLDPHSYPQYFPSGHSPGPPPTQQQQPPMEQWHQGPAAQGPRPPPPLQQQHSQYSPAPNDRHVAIQPPPHHQNHPQLLTPAQTPSQQAFRLPPHPRPPTGQAASQHTWLLPQHGNAAAAAAAAPATPLSQLQHDGLPSVAGAMAGEEMIKSEKRCAVENGTSDRPAVSPEDDASGPHDREGMEEQYEEVDVSGNGGTSMVGNTNNVEGNNSDGRAREERAQTTGGARSDDKQTEEIAKSLYVTEGGHTRRVKEEAQSQERKQDEDTAARQKQAVGESSKDVELPQNTSVETMDQNGKSANALGEEQNGDREFIQVDESSHTTSTVDVGTTTRQRSNDKPSFGQFSYLNARTTHQLAVEQGRIEEAGQGPVPEMVVEEAKHEATQQNDVVMAGTPAK